jgi:selenocysteine lyase/cysteine desulfurase
LPPLTAEPTTVLSDPIADLAHAHDTLFYTDAMQAVGMIDIDVRALGIDLLCCGGYKWPFAGFFSGVLRGCA